MRTAEDGTNRQKKMKTEPLFNDDIIGKLGAYYRFFFTQTGLFEYAAYLVLFLAANMLLVKFFFIPEPMQSFSTGIYGFRKEKSSAKWFALLLLGLSFALYALNTVTQENTLFNNFDLMSANAIDNMYQGNLSIMDAIRFTPLAGIDHNLIYAVSRNYAVINFFIILKQLLCLFLLYKFLSFMPVTKRLATLAVINFLPAVFVVNNVIFAEQLILIYVLASFLFLNHYAKTGKNGSLFAFVLFLNLALYTKETVILLYAGLLACLVIGKVFNGGITLSSFLSPVKTLRKMPVEYMLFLSLFIFFTCWLMVQDPSLSGAYMRVHRADMKDILHTYKFELLLNAAALLSAAGRIFQTKAEKARWYAEGVLAGCLLLTAVVVFRLQMVAVADSGKTYYLYLPAVFCTAYIFYTLKEKAGIWITGALIVLWSAADNCDIRQQEQGRARREAAEFILSLAQKEPLDLHIYSLENPSLKWWKTTCFGSAMKYMFPQDLSVRIKTDARPLNLHVDDSRQSYEVSSGAFVAGDCLLLPKKFLPYFEKPQNYHSVYENRAYRIYLPE